MARRNRLTISRDKGKLTQLVLSSSHELRILGTTSFWVKIHRFPNLKFIRGIVVDWPNMQPEILVGWRYLKDWGVFPAIFPYPESSRE